MSGGSYDYISFRVDDAADQVERSAERYSVDPDPESSWYSKKLNKWVPETHPEVVEQRKNIAEARLFLARITHLVAEALHQVEWVDSCDTSPGDELASIQALRDALK